MRELTKEMQQYYRGRMKEDAALASGSSAAIEELDARLATLRERLKKGDPDMERDELAAVIESGSAKRARLEAADKPAIRMEVADMLRRCGYCPRPPNSIASNWTTDSWATLRP